MRHVRGQSLTTLAAMPGKKRLAGALAVAAAAVAISACGSSSSDKTIDPGDAQLLQSRLSAVQLAVSEGRCDIAQTRAQSFVDAVNALPDTVGTEDKAALRSAGENLEKLAQDPSNCRPTPTGTSGLQGDQSTTSSTTTTEVAPTTTETTTTSSTTEESPSGNGAGNSGGGEAGGEPSGNTGGGQTGGGDTGGGGETGGGGAAGGGEGSGSGGTGGTGGTGVGGGGTG